MKHRRNMTSLGFMLMSLVAVAGSPAPPADAPASHKLSADAARTAAPAKLGADAVVTQDITIQLPPLARLLDEDTSGKTWRQTGDISGTLEVAHKNFQRSLRKQGWALAQTIPMAKGAGRSQLCLWHRGGRELLVMLWQKEPGTSGFSWGIQQ